jgi:hypothetical protein
MHSSRGLKKLSQETDSHPEHRRNKSARKWAAAQNRDDESLSSPSFKKALPRI